ncbi:MAG: EAL domain-containing protein [Pseudomonadales bacterium]
MSKSLLVVEDEVLVARDIKARLTRMGYDVVDIASRGKEAIEKALNHRPDLVLMDINLRDEMDGVEAAIRIREQYDVPVIFCTAYSNEDTLERAKISEPYGYVLKPFDNRELEINIEIALYKHRVEKDLTDTRRRLDATLTNVSDGVIAADVDGKIYLINPMAEKITGWCRRKAKHVHLSNVLPLEPFESGERVFDTFNPCSDPEEWNIQYLRQYLRRPGGHLLPVELSVNRIENHDSDLMVITFRDISQQLNYEEQIRHNAFFDDLTGLPNRALFFDRLDGSLNRRKRGGHEHFAVAFLGLDGFGVLNEGLGHEAGDRVIKEVAQRLENTVRPDDTLSRFSGDIFAVLFDPVDAVTGSIQAVQRIQAAIEQPIWLDESTSVNLTASAGLVLHQDQYASPEDMIRDADTALHRSKTDAKGAYVVFDNEMYENALRFIEYKSGMQQGLNEGAFEVHYQPIVDSTTELVVSMEALVRWTHPVLGAISPAEFIPVAEETGLILPLGEWVLRSVCEQINAWNKASISGFRVAVNLSARQFDNNVSGLIAGILDETGVSPHSLTIEITEGIAMKNVEQNIRMLAELRALGLEVSIDDFGTGYSSLAYLRRFPLNTLKIDRSFIQEITTNDEDREITRAIIAMAQNLRLKVLAEGVEDVAQFNILKASGCDYIQGYYYSKAIAVPEMTRMLESQRAPASFQGKSEPPSTSRVAPVM